MHGRRRDDLLLYWHLDGMALRGLPLIPPTRTFTEEGWQTFMGVILGSAVVPIALCVTWSRANKWGCIGGSVVGFFAGLIAWLVTTSSLNGGVINVKTSGGDYEMLAGNLASICIGGIIAVAASLMVSHLSSPPA